MITAAQKKYLDAFIAFWKRAGRTPTHRELAKEVGVSETAAAEALRRLVRSGALIEVRPRGHNNRFALPRTPADRLEAWAKSVASYLRRCNRFDLTRELEGILNETL